MPRPLFGPARQTLGHPATTRFLDSLETDADRLEQQHRDQLVTKYLTKPIVVTPVGGGEERAR